MLIRVWQVLTSVLTVLAPVMAPVPAPPSPSRCRCAVLTDEGFRCRQFFKMLHDQFGAVLKPVIVFQLTSWQIGTQGEQRNRVRLMVGSPHQLPAYCSSPSETRRVVKTGPRKRAGLVEHCPQGLATLELPFQGNAASSSWQAWKFAQQYYVLILGSVVDWTLERCLRGSSDACDWIPSPAGLWTMR
jgi:hypothetical protein